MLFFALVGWHPRPYVRILNASSGPCQPSMVYRYLRNLEGVSPPLALTHLTCQTTAKAFTATRESRHVYEPY